MSFIIFFSLPELHALVTQMFLKTFLKSKCNVMFLYVCMDYVTISGDTHLSLYS